MVLTFEVSPRTLELDDEELMKRYGDWCRRNLVLKRDDMDNAEEFALELSAEWDDLMYYADNIRDVRREIAEFVVAKTRGR